MPRHRWFDRWVDVYLDELSTFSLVLPRTAVADHLTGILQRTGAQGAKPAPPPSTAFGPGQTPRLQTLMHWASQQARTPYRLDGLSADNRQLPGAVSPIERSSEMRIV